MSKNGFLWKWKFFSSFIQTIFHCATTGHLTPMGQTRYYGEHIFSLANFSIATRFTHRGNCSELQIKSCLLCLPSTDQSQNKMHWIQDIEVRKITNHEKQRSLMPLGKMRKWLGWVEKRFYGCSNFLSSPPLERKKQRWRQCGFELNKIGLNKDLNTI